MREGSGSVNGDGLHEDGSCSFSICGVARYFPTNRIPAVLFQPISEACLPPWLVSLNRCQSDFHIRIGGAVSHL